MRQEISEYVCDTDEYHAMWSVALWPYFAIPALIVALAVILIALAF